MALYQQEFQFLVVHILSKEYVTLNLVFLKKEHDPYLYFGTDCRIPIILLVSVTVEIPLLYTACGLFMDSYTTKKIETKDYFWYGKSQCMTSVVTLIYVWYLGLLTHGYNTCVD